MRKVGIITLFNLNNYGNRLQAYALSKVVEDLKYKAVEVRYCKKSISFFVKELFKKNLILLNIYYFFTGILNRESFKGILNECKRYSLFYLFSKKIKRKTLFSDSDSFEYYLCGSDQIWNPTFAGTSGYFASFAKKEKRISYAASFGVSELPDEVKSRYKKNLEDMQHISVRETKGIEIIKNLTGREVCEVIDPTLMIDKNEWKKVSKKPKYHIKGRYIFAYFLSGISEEARTYISKVAEENNFQIILLDSVEKNEFWYKTGPSEFIWLIENASLVCTNSFHASVFSVLMDSPFIVFRRGNKENNMHSRFESLLGKLKLTDRFFEQLKSGEEFKKDYSHIPEILNSERKKAYAFLSEALDLKNRGDIND